MCLYVFSQLNMPIPLRQNTGSTDAPSKPEIAPQTPPEPTKVEAAFVRSHSVHWSVIGSSRDPDRTDRSSKPDSYMEAVRVWVE